MLAFLGGFSSTTSMGIVAALALIIEKFARLTDDARAGGAGLGLAICREVMGNLRGRSFICRGNGRRPFAAPCH